MLELAAVEEDPTAFCALLDVDAIALVGPHCSMALGACHVTHDFIVRVNAAPGKWSWSYLPSMRPRPVSLAASSGFEGSTR